MKFLVHAVQNGGCDYTIGCGNRVYHIRVPDMTTAMATVEHQWFGDCETEPDPSGRDHRDCRNGDPEVHLTRVSVYPIGDNHLNLDLNKAISNRELRLQAANAAAQRIKDEAQFEALKRKLGK